MRLIQKEDPEEQAALDAFKSVYKKLKPLNWIVLAIYILIPIFEKPSWCVLNPEIDTSTTQGYWYCNDADGMITNSGIPKLPPQITESIELFCLVTMLSFPLARDRYRRIDDKTARNIHIGLTISSSVDLIITLICVSIPWTQDQLNNPIVSFFIFPYINAISRPVLITISIRALRQYWRRYLLVMKGTGPFAIFILVFVFYYAWMGNRLFSGTIEGVDNFKDMQDSFFFMFVCLTTSNYPDVMLPSYA